MQSFEDYEFLCCHGGPGLDSWVYQQYLPKALGSNIHYFDQSRPGDFKNWLSQLIIEGEKIRSKSDRKIILFGHSAGGCLAIRGIKDRPDLFAYAISVSSPFDASVDEDFMEWLKNPNQKVEFKLKQRQLPLIPEVPDHDFDYDINEPLANEFHQKWKLFFPASFKENLKNFFDNTQFCIQSAMSFYTDFFGDYQLGNEINGIEDKILYLYPSNDQRVTPNHIKKIFLIPKIKFDVVEGSHFNFIDHPQDLNRAIHQFLSP